MANDLVIEANWDGKLDVPTEAMVSVFEQAARFALVAEERLQQQVQTGQCMSNPEAWFTSFSGTQDLPIEREQATRLCAGCPVRAQCLALDFTAARGRTSWVHGVWGGLGPRDRLQLQPLWQHLISRLRAESRERQSWRTRPTHSRSIVKGAR